MKRIRIIARQQIINPSSKKVHNDIGLRALEGYCEDVFEVEDNYDKYKLALQFEEKHSSFKGYFFEFEELD